MVIKRWIGRVNNIKIKLGINGGVSMNKFKSFNLNSLQNRKTTIISTQESLKDVTPINWSAKVLSGEKKVLVDYNNK